MPTINKAALLAQAQKKLHKQMLSVQTQALSLATKLDLNLDGILIEGLSVPARGAAFSVKELGQFSELLGDSLVALTTVGKCLSECGVQLAKANQKRADAGNYMMEQVGPHLQSAAKGITRVGAKINNYSSHLKRGHYKDCTGAFGDTIAALGDAVTGMGQVFQLTSKLDATVMAPATEKFTSASHRLFEALHSAAESIREFCQAIHLKCIALSEKINMKSNSKANQKLDALASEVATKATSLLWSFMASPQDVPLLESPKNKVDERPLKIEDQSVPMPDHSMNATPKLS